MVYYYEFLRQFGVTERSAGMIILAFACVSVFALVLRIIACVGYQSQYAIFKLYGKEIKVKTDAVNVRHGLIGKAVADYMAACEKGASGVSSAAIVGKHLTNMGFIFWKYDSMAAFIKAYENACLIIGLLLAFFLDYPAFFGIMSIVVFLFLRVCASVFDFDLAKIKLANETVEYLDKEIGQFYTPDLSSGINRLRTEMADAAARQAVIFENAVRQMTESLSESMKVTLGEISLDDTVSEWKTAVASAADFTKNIGAGLKSYESVIVTFKASADFFNNSFAEYADGMKKLAESIDARFAAQDMLDKNQALLNDSFNKFELSLQDITGKLGNSLATLVEHRLQASYGTLNDSINDNIRQIINSNNEYLSRMQKLFDALGEQSAAETRAILRATEQMDGNGPRP